MTETYEPELRRFRELMEGPSAERAAAATTALEQRNLEEYQRIMSERSQVVAPRDPETRMLVHSSELGEPGLPDAWVRARVAVADTREERQAAFNQIYPFGEIRPGRDEAGARFEIYRRDPGEPWSKFDPPIMEKFEPIEDIADFASAALPLAGEALTTRGAGGLLRRTLQTAGGAAIGELAEEGLEDLGGQQRQDVGEVALQAGQEGLTAGIGSMLTEPLRFIINSRRAGALPMRPGAPEAIAAAERQGLPPIMPFQATSDPIAQTMGSQARALTNSIEEFALQQEAAAATRMQELALAAGDPEVLPLRLRTRVRAARSELDLILERPDVTLGSGGEALQQGLREYDQIARAEVDELYTAARNLEEPTFDIQGIKQVAEDLDAGIRARGVEGEDIRVSGSLPAELQAVINDIRALDETLPAVTVTLSDGTERAMTATDQLRALRERLWDLKTVDAGQIARRPEYNAGRLYGAITEALENPATATEGFKEAWDAANAAARARFTTWERAVIRTTAKSETPTILANNYAKPLQVDNLRTLRETLPAENWSTFQSAVKADFLGDLPNLTNRLASFDQPTLNMLLPFRQQTALREVATSFDRMAAADGLAQMTRYQDIANRVISASDGSTAVSLAETIGGVSSPEGRALRAGIINNIADAVIEMKQGIPTLNRSGLTDILQKMDQNGSARFLTNADREALNDLDRYMDLVKGVPDVGTSLMRASIVKQLRELNVKAAFDIVQAYTVGRLMTTSQGRRFLMGAGQDKLNLNGLRLLGAAGATIAADSEALGLENGD